MSDQEEKIGESRLKVGGSPLLWPYSTGTMNFTILCSLVVGMLLSADWLNSTSLLRSSFLGSRNYLELFRNIQVLQILVIVACVYIYRRIRSQKRYLLDVIVFILGVCLAMYVYVYTTHFLDFIFSPDSGNAAHTSLNFSGPSGQIVAGTWLLMAMLAVVDVIKRKICEFNGEGSPPEDQKHKLVILSSVCSVMGAIFGVALVLLGASLILFSSASFIDIGSGLLLGAFSFWILVMLINTTYVWRGYNWPAGLRQSTLMSGYSLIVTMIVFFFCNSADRWVWFATATLLLMGTISMASYKGIPRYRD